MPAGRFHIIIDINGISNKILTREEGLRDFIISLVGKIEMNVLYGPIVVSGIPENPGLSGFCIIDFSHVSVHTFTASSEALVDIFSCKTYDKQEALSAVMKYFKAKKENVKFKEVYWQ